MCVDSDVATHTHVTKNDFMRKLNATFISHEHLRFANIFLLMKIQVLYHVPIIKQN